MLAHWCSRPINRLLLRCIYGMFAFTGWIFAANSIHLTTLQTTKSRAFEMKPIKPGFFRRTTLIASLLMPQLSVSPAHQQPCDIESALSKSIMADWSLFLYQNMPSQCVKQKLFKCLSHRSRVDFIFFPTRCVIVVSHRWPHLLGYHHVNSTDGI